MNVDQLRALFLSYPGVTEAPSYGTPGFRVRKKLLARLHQSERAVVLSVADVDAQQALVAMKPAVFYVTDHYEGHGMVLARLSRAPKGLIREVFEAAWRRHASRQQLADFDARG